MPGPEPDDATIANHRRPDTTDAEARRRRLGRAHAELLGTVLAVVSGVSALLLWHLARRGRVLRDRLGPPRPVRWPEPTEADPDDSEPIR